jgi:hypothetical protein
VGQARLRGTKDERTAARVEAVERARAERKAERDRIDRERNEKAAAVWATLTPEQREARLQKATQEVSQHAQLCDTFGSGVGSMLFDILDSAKNGRRPRNRR